MSRLVELTKKEGGLKQKQVVDTVDGAALVEET